MIDFLLESQAKMTIAQKQVCLLDEIKEECLNLIANKKNKSSFSQIIETQDKLKIIPHYIPDEEYAFLFKENKKKSSILSSSHLSSPGLQMSSPGLTGGSIENVFALFTSPLNQNWQEAMTCQGDEQFAIRTGFYQDEFDIYQSILMGFQGLTIYVSGLDVFQLQYLTEVARDYSFSLFFVLHNKQELNLILQTDAPYLVFSVFQKKDFSIQNSLLYNLSQFVPKSANLFALATQDVLKDKKSLVEMGYCGVIIS